MSWASSGACWSSRVGGELGVIGGGVVVRVLDDALAHAESEVETAEAGVALLEVFDDAQGVEIVIKAQAVLAESVVEGALAGVAEGRVADVVDQRERLGEVLVEAERGGDGARDLRDLHGCG